MSDKRVSGEDLEAEAQKVVVVQIRFQISKST